MNQVSAACVQRLRQHLFAAAPRYYPELAGRELKLELVDAVPHTASTIYHFRLKAGSDEQGVLVKTPPLTTPESAAPLTAPAIKFRAEYQALVDIHAYFNRLGDARFAAVRPLDFVAEVLGIVMEEVTYPTLRALFSKSSRLQPWGRRAGFFLFFRHAGSWLRAFHALNRGGHATPREVDRDAYCDVLDRLTGTLTAAIGNAAFFRQLTCRLHQEALDVLPALLPLGLTHGDYALRNLLVAPGPRVLALDTQARWRMPVYEDIAYFLTGLITTWPQVLSQGLVFAAGHLEHCSREFLQGYFEGETIPWEIIRLFRLKLMLQKWSAKSLRMQRQFGNRHAATVRQKLLHRFFYKTVTAMLESRPAAVSTHRASLTPRPAPATSLSQTLPAEELLLLSRRIDWRFLLPEPRLQQVAYFGPQDNTLIAALRCFSQSLTVFTQPPAGLGTSARFNVAVAVAPGLHELAAIAAGLRPGGCLYVEIGSVFARCLRQGRQGWRQALRGPKAYAAELRRLGLEQTAMYWHRPGFATAVQIIPLHDALAAKFVRARRAHDLKSRLIAILDRVVLRSGALVRGIACVSLVARKNSST
ncbi:MAG: phosphotransferase [candidate division KSB1 bacterium]|nr:phosphotransferase [candidate division KSB1 bacterium]MDZ7276153.1 phosphotransferase [candidate division KSB1 bacterium]MDZ7287067.1 phosphotransferase [candidate division KSB1 bacterium]MDZ7297008.1 phosphotransferase [candidate division KSB1 bacterium]MDZ7307514.1 phosphotransferase [candidate division KSB1 bacterium]